LLIVKKKKQLCCSNGRGSSSLFNTADQFGKMLLYKLRKAGSLFRLDLDWPLLRPAAALKPETAYLLPFDTLHISNSIDFNRKDRAKLPARRA
jgi:hypothetical protein